jgi:hypothetical protein
MQVVKDGRAGYQQLMEDLEVSTIFFTMIDVETGIPKIVSAPCEIVNLILPWERHPNIIFISNSLQEKQILLADIRANS